VGPLFVAMLLCGCSVSYFEDDGARYVVGPALVSYSDPAEDERCADSPEGIVQRPVGIATLGIAWHRGLGGEVLGVGYSRLQDAGLRSVPVETDEAGVDCEILDRSEFTFYTRIDPAPKATDAGTVVAVDVLGLAWTANEKESALVVGYRSSALISVDDDVFIAGNPIRALERRLP
jgi:hypothetical protein